MSFLRLIPRNVYRPYITDRILSVLIHKYKNIYKLFMQWFAVVAVSSIQLLTTEVKVS